MRHSLDFATLTAAYASGETDPEAIVVRVLEALEALGDPAIFISLRDADALRAEARAIGAFDPSRPLWGLPFAVKDNIDVAGLETTAACPAFAYRATGDAAVVARLRSAGAIPIGKTNLDQFATGLVGTRSPYGAPLNAVDPGIVPGGSSSGSGVAVARGLVSFALGTDTAGSGRVPAALQNIVGLKPTLGAWSARGVVPACRTSETVSVFALTVADAHAVHRVATAFDPDDPFSRAVAAGAIPAPPPAPVIAVPRPGDLRTFGDDVQARSFADSTALLAGAGATIREIDMAPFHDVAEMLYDGAWVAERHTVIADLLARDPEAILPVTRAIIGKAEALSAADAFRGIYRLKSLARTVERVMAGADALCVPSIPTFCTVAEVQADPMGPNAQLGTYTNFVNLLDLCAIAVPVPPRSDGRPGSITLIGRAGADGLLAALAGPLEAAGERHLGATGWPRPASADRAAGAPEGTMELAVCGAHMSGLPLNGELTSRGAVFLRGGETAPDYRLYALAPDEGRPGLLRASEGQGARIALEIWAVPLAEVGSFLAGIPAPLGLGRIRLDGGGEVCGFLCEGEGLAGAREITHLGGWRAHLAQHAAA